MSRLFITLLMTCAGMLARGQGKMPSLFDPLAYVDPFVGTAKSTVFTRWGNEGGTYPGAVAPWGLMQLTPETRNGGGYDHGDSTIYFFSCWHHLSGYPGGSAGQVKIMPLAPAGRGVGQSGTSEATAPLTGRTFLHEDEKASPGYYRVQFPDDRSLVEVTASGRVGLFRCTFPAHVSPEIFIGGKGKITLNKDRSLQGAAFPLVMSYEGDVCEEEAVKDGMILHFSPSAVGPTVIVLRISISSAGVGSARKNIDKETGGLGFDQVKERTANEWRKELSVIHVEDTNEEKKKIFYTALYHSLLLPWIISDVEGKYKGYDGLIHTASGKNEYGQFSPWDTFRSLHPLLSLLFPRRQRDIVLSMLDVYHQTGHLPIESMTGNHAIPVIVDSWMKGIRGFDSTMAFTAMKRSLAKAPFLQPDMEIYHRLGYIPFTYPESVTRTVEYAYDDWALGQFAGQVLHREKEKTLWEERSYHYRNLFYPDELLLLPRDGNQFKIQPGTTGYKEGDQWVYSFFAPQHVKDLINLMGGEKAFVSRLDSALTSQTIVFDNETVFHIPYLFNDAGRADRTQYWVRTIMDNRFAATPGGLPGNDDLGSLSSWFVLSAMGIYPVCPGKPVYDIGSPLFSSVTLHLQNGKKMVIQARNAGGKNIYVKSWRFSNKKYTGYQLPHAWIEGGGTLTMEMSDKPEGLGIKESSEGQPDFRMEDVSLSKEVVAPHELFWMRYSLRNRGSTGTKIIKLFSNGREVAHKNSLVAAGAMTIDSIACRLYPYGMTQLSMEGRTMEIMVRRSENGGDSLAVDGLVVRPLLLQGERQRLSFNAQNIGGEARTFHLPVKVNNVIVRTDTLVLEPGEKKTVSQEIAIEGTGMQAIDVLEARESCKVYGRSEESLLLDLLPAMDSLVRDGSGFGNAGRIIRETPGNGIKERHDTGAIGKNAGRLLFGQDCYIEVANSLSLDSLGETLTMMAWVYPIKKGEGLVDLFTKGDNNVLQVVDNKSLSFFAGGWGRGDCTVDLPADWWGHWHHIAGVCRGSMLELYIDGEQRGHTQVGGGVNLSGTNKWTLGRNEEFPGKRIFNGYMDGVKLFGAPLSGEEIRVIVDREAEERKRR